MRLLELGIRLMAGYSAFSLLLGLSIIHSKLEKEPPWTRNSGGSPLDIAALQPTKTDLKAEISTPISTRFFPTYGTDEYFQQCGWTSQKSDRSKRDCTFLVRPKPETAEGISHWIPQIVAGHLLAQQTGCNLYFDYGPNISIQQVLTPFPIMDSTDFQPFNWTVPSGFVCNETESSTCFLPRPNYAGIKHIEHYENVLNMNLSEVPDYRSVYRYSRDYFLKQNEFRDVMGALPGLQLETGMACSLGSLFHLAPSAAQFEPDLFTRILPTLHQDNTLVMALYIRTGHADVMATKEKDGNGKATEATTTAKRFAEKIIYCALGLEQEYLSNNTFSYSQVVWMVATDSQFVKEYVTKTHDSRHVNTTTIPREIVTTSSRGVHSRAARDPSTADFAEALIDWYLIGESDLVIVDATMAPSFGDTAALRTARPLYKACWNPPLCQQPRLFDSMKR